MEKKILESLSYEQAYEQLEKLVAKLESGDLALEKSLKIFEESIKLVGYCTKKLEEAERKIELLIESSDETITTVAAGSDFDL